MGGIPPSLWAGPLSVSPYLSPTGKVLAHASSLPCTVWGVLGLKKCGSSAICASSYRGIAMLVHLNSRNLFTQKPERIFQLSRMDRVDLLYLCVDCTVKWTGESLVSYSVTTDNSKCIKWSSVNAVVLRRTDFSLSFCFSCSWRYWQERSNPLNLNSKCYKPLRGKRN